MAQPSYPTTRALGMPGQLGDASPKRVSTRVNENASAINVGIFVAHGVAVNGANLLAAATDQIDGIAVKADVHAVTSDLTGTLSISNEEIFDVLEEGEAWVRADSLLAAGAQVFARFAAGSASVIGAARGDVDGGTARAVAGCTVVKSATSFLGALMALVRFSKTVNDAGSDVVELVVAKASDTATATTYLTKTRADRFFVLDSASVIIPVTGITADPSNCYAMSITDGTTSGASFNTGTTAIVAGTPADMTPTAPPTVYAPGSVLKFVETLTGTKTSPAGSIVVRGRYI